MILLLVSKSQKTGFIRAICCNFKILKFQVEQAKVFKDKGTRFFKENKFELAANKYRKIIDFLEHELSLKGEIEEDRKGLLLAGRLNLAMCLLRQNEWIEAR